MSQDYQICLAYTSIIHTAAFSHKFRQNDTRQNTTTRNAYPSLCTPSRSIYLQRSRGRLVPKSLSGKTCLRLCEVSTQAFQMNERPGAMQCACESVSDVWRMSIRSLLHLLRSRYFHPCHVNVWKCTDCKICVIWPWSPLPWLCVFLSLLLCSSFVTRFWWWRFTIFFSSKGCIKEKHVSPVSLLQFGINQTMTATPPCSSLLLCV